MKTEDTIVNIKFEYFHLIGPMSIPPRSTEELAFDGYALLDANGIIVASGTSVAGLIQHAQSLDVNHHLSMQFVDRKLPTRDHLEGMDIDRRPDTPTGLMVPSGLLGGGSGPISH